MKRIISVLLSLIIIMSCTMAYAGEMEAKFELADISTNDALSSNKLKISITLPSAVEGGTLIVACYTDGACTNIFRKDMSTTNKFSIMRDEIIPTPDRIKLMLWEKGRIRPLSSAQDVLTQEVCESVNDNVLTLLDNLFLTTNAIRAQMGQSDTSQSAEDIRLLVDAIDSCATKAKDGEYSKKYLLTSDFCNREFSDELKSIQELYNSFPTASKDKLKTMYLSYLDDEYVIIIDNFMKFFKIDLDLR